MTSLRSGWTAVVLIAAAVLGWLGALLAPSLGLPAPVVGVTGLVTVAAVSGLCLVLAWRVRRDRERPLAQRMDPIAAARTLVLGQAAGFTGAALAGWHGAVAAQALDLGARAYVVKGPRCVQALRVVLEGRPGL